MRTEGNLRPFLLSEGHYMLTRAFNEIVEYKNHYELILTDKFLNEVGRAKIDKEDLVKVKSIGRWSLRKDGYVSNRKASMHRLIAGAVKGDEVDHRKTGIRSRSDNRKKNLRLCTRNQNQHNKNIQANNTSGFKGVTYHKRDKSWIAEIRLNGKRVRLGYFKSAEDASEAYNKASKKFHKEFSHKSLR